MDPPQYIVAAIKHLGSRICRAWPFSDFALPRSKVARRIVCAAQGDYIPFSYLSDDFHKKLRLANADGDQTTVNSVRDQLDKFLDSSLSNAAATLFDKAEKHFRGRHPVAPRFCVKGVRETLDGTTFTYTIWRHKYPPKDKQYKDEYPIDRHSIFKNMGCVEGSPAKGIVLNNIPNVAARDKADPSRYWNERLDHNKAQAYWKKWGHCRRCRGKADEEWMACWKAEHPGAPNGVIEIEEQDWCYKSALVVPISLGGNFLDSTFKEEFNKKWQRFIINADVERYIFGFVCFDHVDCNYFQEDDWSSDMNLGYMIADIMSMYILKRNFLIDTSEEYQKRKIPNKAQTLLHEECGIANIESEGIEMVATAYQVFLSHNSKDKSAVRELKEILEGRAIKVWYDEDQLRPGINWQPLTEQGILESASGAVLVGRDGLGPWENEEMQALLRQAVETGKPVIPVLLPNAPEAPKLPLFLNSRTWINFKDSFDEEGIRKLIWGITGTKPST